MKTIIAEWKCPYCGFENKTYCEIEKLSHSPIIEYCAIEDGGCDKEVVLNIDIVANVKVRKIID